MNKVFSNPVFISTLDTYGDTTGFILLDNALAAAKAGQVNPDLITSAANSALAMVQKYNLFNLGVIDSNDLYLLRLVTSGVLYTNNVQDQTLLSNIVKFGDALSEANKMAGYALNMILK